MTIKIMIGLLVANAASALHHQNFGAAWLFGVVLALLILREWGFRAITKRKRQSDDLN